MTNARRQFIRPSWSTFAACLLIVVGVLQNAAGVLQSAFGANAGLSKLGFALAASPRADVFGSYAGVEPLSQRYSILLEFNDLPPANIVLDRKLSRLFDHGDYLLRFAPYFYAVAWHEVIDPRLVDQLLEYGMCNGGPLAERLGAQSKVLRIRVRSQSRKHTLPEQPIGRAEGVIQCRF